MKIVVISDLDSIRYIVDSDEFRISGDYLSLKIGEDNFIFIKSNHSNFVMSSYYYSWSILTFMMKYTLDKMGMMLNDKGLYYVIPDGNIFLTNSIKHILDILGLDDRKYRDGFESKQSQIDFMMTSFYFNPTIFKDIDIPDDILYSDNKAIKDFVNNYVSNIHMDAYYKFKDNYMDVISVFFPDIYDKIYKYLLRKVQK